MAIAQLTTHHTIPTHANLPNAQHNCGPQTSLISAPTKIYMLIGWNSVLCSRTLSRTIKLSLFMIMIQSVSNFNIFSFHFHHRPNKNTQNLFLIFKPNVDGLRKNMCVFMWTSNII